MTQGAADRSGSASRPTSSAARDELAVFFDRQHWARPLTTLERQRLKQIADLLQSLAVDSLLDVGCGDGRLINVLRAQGFSGRVVGCDASHAGLLRLSVPAVQGDLGRLPFAASSFDCVCCCEVLEHLDDALLSTAVGELQRVAARYILLTVPRDEQLAKGYAKCTSCGHQFHVHGHKQQFSASRLEQLCPGWTIVRSGAFGVGSRRRYHPLMMRLKHSFFGCWAWSPGLTCPRCRSRLPVADKKIVRAGLGALNLILNPRRRAGGWLYALFAHPGERLGQFPVADQFAVSTGSDE